MSGASKSSKRRRWTTKIIWGYRDDEQSCVIEAVAASEKAETDSQFHNGFKNIADAVGEGAQGMKKCSQGCQSVFERRDHTKIRKLSENNWEIGSLTLTRGMLRTSGWTLSTDDVSKASTEAGSR